MENLNKLRDEAYRIACEHGWHDEKHSYQHWIMLIISEISEAVEADRRNRHADRSAYEHDTTHALRELHLTGEAYKTYESSCFNTYIKDSVEDEMADVVIRILDMCGRYGISLDDMPDAFAMGGNSKNLIAEIESLSMTEFAYLCTRLAVQICEAGICWGYVQNLLHKIYLFSVMKGFDLEWHVREKMKYNEKRPYKHGKSY